MSGSVRRITTLECLVSGSVAQLAKELTKAKDGGKDTQLAALLAAIEGLDSGGEGE